MISISTRLYRIFMAFTLGALLFCAGCGGARTQLSATWTSPDYAQIQDVDEVLVVAVTATEVRRGSPTHIRGLFSKQTSE